MMWLTAANLLYLASYSVRDILWLRVLSVIAGGLLIEYYCLQPAPLFAAMAWNIGFCAINVAWTGWLVYERRPVKLREDEEHLRQIAFPSLSAREACNLYKTGVWRDVDVGESLVEHDRTNRRFSVILTGIADVTYRGDKVAELGEGQFVGEIDSYAEKRAGLDVVAKTGTRVLCWHRTTLNQFLERRPDVALALERSIGLHLRQLLETLETGMAS